MDLWDGHCPVLLSLATSIIIRIEFHKRQRAEESILLEKEQLARHTDDLGLISACSELIQAAANEEEVYTAFEQVLQKMLPDSAGFVALLWQAGNTAEVCSSWGDGSLYGSFQRHDCFALQLNRVFHRSQSLSHMYCRHTIASRVDSICIPPRGAESPIGVLHLGTPTEIPPERAHTVTLLAGHLGFGLTNLHLREALKEQSIRDGLTGLFNRRYFDETLQRELANSIRQAKSLCLLMFDIDHFKRLNDQYGHSAGDEALRTLGELMRTSFREGDILCRYGGEEFAVILIGAELSDAFSKAEELRHLVQKAVVRADFQVIENMTVSIGIAASLEFKTVGKLVRAADTALYQAKHSGRNATWVCSSGAPGLPSILGAEGDVGAERTVADG